MQRSVIELNASAVFVLSPCYQCCPDDGVKVHLRPCDLRTVSRRFDQGHYSSVVSIHWVLTFAGGGARGGGEEAGLACDLC